MDWGELGKTFARGGLNVLGTALLGPAGPAVGGWIASALGLDPEKATPDQVQAAFQGATPEQITALKKLENENAADIRRADLRARELALEWEKSRLADVSNARARDLQLQSSGKSNTRANLMIVGDVIGLVAGIVAMIYLAALPGAELLVGAVGVLVGHFGTGLTSAHQFEFGSSRGSKEKDETQRGLQTQLQEAFGALPPDTFLKLRGKEGTT